jgi:short-chain Z-isoprenyl diphosphate synthase
MHVQRPPVEQLAATFPQMLSVLYRLYERRLLHEVQANAVPRHIGIILDGNRRYGREQGLHDPRQVYELGARKLDEVLDWCADLGVSAITLWVFSTANLDRDADEVSGILGAVEAKMRLLAVDPQIHSRRVRVRAVGRLELVPASTVAAIRAAEQATETYETLSLTIAVAYGGREEITDAFRAFLRDQMRSGKNFEQVVEQISPAAIDRYLYTAGLPDPDLIIRTSGEIRLSGFLLWQSAHSEFYFSDVYWPAFRKIDFLRAIRSFQQRQRRFGR